MPPQAAPLALYPRQPIVLLRWQDLCFYEGPRGGAVFSVGSISWCGGLLVSDGRNTVATVTENVIRRFEDPRPFVTGGAKM